MKKNQQKLNKKKYREPLLRRIVIVVSAFILMIATSASLTEEITTGRLSSEAISLVTQTMLKIEADFSGPMTAVNVTAETLRGMIMQGSGEDEIRGYLVEVSGSLQSQKFGMDLGRMYGYFDAFDGGSFFDPLGADEAPDFDPTVQPWYQAAVKASGEIGMTEVFISTQMNEETISFARRIFGENGVPLGVVSLDIPFQQLREHIAELHFSDGTGGSYGFLMNNELEIIAHPSHTIEGMSMYDLPIESGEFIEVMDQLENELKAGESLLEYEMDDYRGETMVACSARLSNGWILTLLTPHFEYYDELYQMESILYLLGTILAAIIISMLVRLNKRTKERNEQFSKLAAVTQNYKGLVWSVDSKNILTSLRGQYMEKMGLDPAEYEGKHSGVIQSFLQVDFDKYAPLAAKDGPQNWMFGINGTTYLSYMAMIRDDKGRPAGFVGSIDDVTEHTVLQRKLEEALAEAEIANKAKSSFLANMSHEIRTPMNAILGITEILVQDEELPAEIMEGLSKIHTSCELLLGIINDILDFSKIEAGKMDLRPAQYEIASLINDSMQLNMMRIGSKPIEFRLQIEEDIPAKLIGDELRIKQILNNLLSNAFKYTDSGTVTLQVGVEKVSEHKVTLVLAVQDTGHGMTRKQIDKLFDEYSRFQAGKTRIVEGTGLGMAITQRLIYLMDGDIRVESEPGWGSEFVVFLPQETVSDEVLGEEIAEKLRNFKLRLVMDRERIRINRDPMPYGKVLVVDDVETNIYVALGLLKLYSLQADAAGSGEEAIDKIRDGKVYDIIFMDHMMPGMDGIETTKILRKQGYREPIVALTANAVAKNADLFLQNGFDDFMAKPIDIRQLNNILNRLVRDKQSPLVLEEARRQKVKAPAVETKPPEAVESARRPRDPLLFASFARDARKAIASLEEWQEWFESEEPESEERRHTVTVIVHGMKSALANIGETDLSALAREMEMAGKQGELVRIMHYLPGFLAKLRALIEQSEPEEENTADEDVTYLREKLKAVGERCEDYDRKGAADILAELGRQKCSRPTRETLDRIVEAVLHSEFEEAGEIAAGFAAALPGLSARGLETSNAGANINITRGLETPAAGANIIITRGFETPAAGANIIITRSLDETAIAGLDIARGLDKYDGNQEIYLKILRSYASSLRRLLDTMELAAADNLTDYEIAVHGIKGASRDIFAESLGQSAAGLEEAARNGNREYIRQQQPEFHKAARRLADEITEMLDGLKAAAKRPLRDRPDQELMSRLCQACEIYDMDGVDMTMAEIEAYEYQNDEGLVAWLRERADVTDFKAMVKRLKS